MTTLKGGLPRVGEPGHTLGGRVLPGYGFPPTEGGEPIKTASSPSVESPAAEGAITNPYLGQQEAIAAGEQIYRGRWVGCHKGGGGVGPNMFTTKLRPNQFIETVMNGRQGTSMPAFGQLLARDEIWQVHAFVVSRDSL